MERDEEDIQDVKKDVRIVETQEPEDSVVFVINNCSFDPIKIWGRYLVLEEAFLKFMKYIPLIPDHFAVTSPYLDDLLIRSCSLLESFFKAGSHFELFDIYKDQIDFQKNLEILRHSPKKASIRNMESVFNQHYNLSPKEVHFIYQGYQCGFFPYLNWNQNTSPNWWNDYNSLKHNGFENSVTYENFRNSLGALFLAIVTHADMIHHLEAISVVDGFDIPSVFSHLYYSSPNYEEIEVPPGHGIVARSSIFGFIYTTSPSNGYSELETKEMMFTPPFDIWKNIKAEREWDKQNRIRRSKEKNPN